jgi:hypothetical protein
MKRLILVTILLTFFCVPALLAASLLDKAVGSEGKGFGGVLVGAIYNPGITEVNKAQESYGFPKFGDVSLGLGGMGFKVIHNKFVIGGAGFANMPLTTEAEINGTNISATISGGYGFFEIGYNLLGDGNLLLSPILGLGGGSTTLVFSSKDDKTYDFDDVVKNPISKEFSIGYGGFGLELGFLMLIRIDFGQKEVDLNNVTVKRGGIEENISNVTVKMKNSMKIGLKVSYFYVFHSGNPSVAGEPQYSGHNIFASLFIGFGYESSSYQKN